MRFRRSRYYYWWQYGVVMIAAFAWMYLRDAGKDAFAFFCGIVAAIGFVVLELLIQLNSVNVTKDGIDSHRPFSQSSFTSFVHLQDISSIDSRVGKALRFGDVRVFSHTHEKTIPGVHEAQKLVRMVKGKLHGNA